MNNNAKDITTSIFNNIERILRLFVPGFIALIIIFWSNDFSDTLDKILDKNIISVIIISFILGMVIYSIHRTFFYLVDISTFIKRRNTLSNMADYLIKVDKRSDSLNKSFFIRGAVIHLAAITAELIIVFCLFNGVCEHIEAFILGIILFIFSIAMKIITIKIEKYTIIEHKG
jgi:hypothetical protein